VRLPVDVLGGVRPYKRSWLSQDIVAGITLAALAIPEVMGYTKIAGMPVIPRPPRSCTRASPRSASVGFSRSHPSGSVSPVWQR
jgi:hypothetical protein